SVWDSVAINGSGFEVIWDSAVGAAPTAQLYDNNGNPVGGTFTVSGAPATALYAGTSLELAQVSSQGTSTWQLSNDDTVAVTSGSTSGGSNPELSVQQYDPAGNPIGPAFTKTVQGFSTFGNVQTTALAGGAYVVSYTDNGDYGGSLSFDLFQANGTHVSGAVLGDSSSAANGSGGPGMGPAAAASLPDGGFVMSWTVPSLDSTRTVVTQTIYTQEFNASGSAVTSAQILGTGSPGEVTVAPNGSYTVTYTDNSGTSQVVLFTEQGNPVANNTNDTIYTPAVSYTAPVGPHNFNLVGSTAQTVTANNLGDTITSNDQASTLIGGSGNDTLVAGHSANVMTGGAGADIFTFKALPWNAGHITDF